MIGFLCVVLALLAPQRSAIATPTNQVAIDNRKNSTSYNPFETKSSLYDDELPSKKYRRRPSSLPNSDDTLEAYVGHVLIIKLARNDYLRSMITKRSQRREDDDDPVEFFPSLAGRPR